MKDTIQMIYRDIPLIVEANFAGEYSIMKHHGFHDYDDWEIDSITICPDTAINDFVHDLIMDNPLEKHLFVTALIKKAQEVYEGDSVELKRAGGTR